MLCDGNWGSHNIVLVTDLLSFHLSITTIILRHAFTNVQKDGSIATTTNIAYETIKRNGQDDLIMKGSSVATSTNVAYGMIKSGEQEDHVYDVIDAPGGINPSGTNESPCLPPSHQLLPTTPSAPTGGNVGVAREREQVVVYATIPADQ